MDQQWPFCTQCIIGGLEQPHSTQNFSDLIFSPIFKTSAPNVHVICASSTVFCCLAASTGMISSFGSAEITNEEEVRREEWSSIDTDSQIDNCISLYKRLTTPPIDWTAIEFPIFFAIINGDATGHQTVCRIDFNVTFNFLTIRTVDDGCVVEIFITNACIASNLIGKHFLAFDILFMF